MSDKVLRVVGVYTSTHRDEFEVIYSVDVITDDPSAYEEGEARRSVWEWRVPFGATDRHHAGGAAFIEAARFQERLAEEVWYAFNGVNSDNRWFPASAEQWRGRQP